MYSLIILFIFFFNTSFSQSRDYIFQKLSNSDGLSQSSAIVFSQDKLGQIWIGTTDGLNKYDGTTFTIYRNEVDNPESISNNSILSIIEDQDGFMWIGTHSGLNRYNPKTNTFKRYLHTIDNNTSLSNNKILTIKLISNGEIWVGTSLGISIYNKATDSFKNVVKNDTVNSLSNNQITSIIETQEGTIFIGSALGLNKLIGRENDDFKFKVIKNSENLLIEDMIMSSNNKLFIATQNKNILEYNPVSESVGVYVTLKDLKYINSFRKQLVFDDQGQLWVSTYNGIQIINKSKQTTILEHDINDTKSLSNNFVRSLFKDKKGTIWIGTFYGGVNIWDKANVNFLNITKKPSNKGLSNNLVSAIAQFENIVFFGTDGGGLNVYDTVSDRYTYIKDENYKDLKGDNIMSLLVSKNQNLWIGKFSSGVAVFNIASQKFDRNIISKKLREYLETTTVNAIKQDTDNNIWLGTFGKGLLRYNLNTQKHEIYKFDGTASNPISGNYIRSILIDSKKNVWSGTTRGLKKLDANGKITSFFYDAKLGYGDDILSVFEDTNQTIWVGTKDKGLFKLEGNNFEHVKIVLNNKHISGIQSILEDDLHNLWMGTSQGLIKFNFDTKAITLYNQNDGIENGEFYNNSSLKVGDSEFYFGGLSGVTFFNTSKISINDYAPQVLLTDFKIQHNTLESKGDTNVLRESNAYTEPVTLRYDEANFSINFSIPNFINSDNNQYSYRLLGLEKQWITTKKTEASYTIQNAGTYVFEVKGANNNGIWNTTPTRIKVIVKPAPWKSYWAYMLYALLIGISIYGLIWIMKSKEKLKNQLQLESIKSEKTKEIHQAKLQLFTNIAHDFRTPLTLILGPLQQILSDFRGSNILYKKLLTIESSANNLLQLINRLMDFRKLETNQLELQAAEGNAVKFLKELFLAFTEFAKNGKYTYTFKTSHEEILVYYDRSKLEQVFYNLISNAFRYTPQGGHISLEITKGENEVSIKLEDTGAGISEKYIDKVFERFFEIPLDSNSQKNYNKGTGIGLSIAKNIVNLHKGNISVKNNIGLGVAFNVLLPLGRAHLSGNEILKDFIISDDVSQYEDQLINEYDAPKEDLKDLLTDGNKNTILLVEDNNKLRSFLKNLLKEDYNVLVAENGKVALKIALKHFPDLIISDVIMPEMVGTELCSLIKNNELTSHIPVILLTSRTSLIYKFEGLESGADDYISKPFNIKEFKLRIKNLLKSKEVLKQKFFSENTLIPSDIEITPLDEELLKKAFEIVEKNISNQDFDVAYFSSELGVSRSILFTKIKTWTNLTPSKFIFEVRLKAAAKLLESHKMNVSDVCYKVGFNKPKYFSMCFKEKYGITPTQYANKFSNL
ncbi:hybrid sensor histidine kinase/response regulator [Polaribacter glomeratus]|uniref:histidine kinase n=1 Tax=Polaribacter glomeratus TaxID=102 RepID=A0A2S7WJL3_9FLAO|nr:hybrid sensor histidine kinase/response regulator [Polaribacter glomeratus]TXD67625.1 response regulator [Polaribacter glomeratus]